MLHSLNDLAPGSPWPPPRMQKHREQLQANRLLFDGDHKRVFEQAVDRRIYREETREAIYFVLNYPRRLSTHWADMLFTEPPIITSEANQAALDEIVRRSKFMSEAYEATIDLSRFGSAVFKVYQDEDGAHVESVTPEAWIPITSETSNRVVTAHVLAFPVTRGEGHEAREYVRFEIHEPGRITHRVIEVKYDRLGDPIPPRELFPDLEGVVVGTDLVESFGLDEFLIVPAFGLRTSDAFYGHDDYSDLESIVSELEVRFSQIARILDKHSDPNLYGDATALETDPETGETTFKGGGKFFPVDQGGTVPGYVTWDGKLEANFLAIDKLMEQFFFTAETSPAAFGMMKQGLAESGSALKRLLINDVLKSQRMAAWLTEPIKEALRIAGQLEGVDLDPGVQWRDGIPNDEVELATVNATLVGAGLRSRFLAVKMLNNLTTDAEVEEELAKIDAEKAEAQADAIALAQATSPQIGEQSGFRS